MNLNSNECISMIMLIRQKLASDSGKNPHYRAIEKAYTINHICSINFLK